MAKINEVYGRPPKMLVHLILLRLKLMEHGQIDWQKQI